MVRRFSPIPPSVILDSVCRSSGAVETTSEANLHDPWGTLGTARYRTGDWKGAVADLEEAIGLRNPDHPHNAYNGFVLAMAHWQLGEKDKARAWFDKSVVRMANGLQGERGAEALPRRGGPTARHRDNEVNLSLRGWRCASEASSNHR
jgi:hypothetical protein